MISGLCEAMFFTKARCCLAGKCTKNWMEEEPPTEIVDILKQLGLKNGGKNG